VFCGTRGVVLAEEDDVEFGSFSFGESMDVVGWPSFVFVSVEVDCFVVFFVCNDLFAGVSDGEFHHWVFGRGRVKAFVYGVVDMKIYVMTPCMYEYG